MRVLISVFLLHLHLFGYSGAALGTDQMCAIPTSDDAEYETVELIFKDEGTLQDQLNDPKMQQYLRRHFPDNGRSCEEQETTTTITTTVTTGSAQPPTITADNDREGPTTQPETTPLLKETTTITETSQPTSTLPNTTTDSQGISTTNMETTEPAATSAQTTQAEDTTDTKMKTTEPAVTSAETTQANAPTTETSTEITTESATTQKPCPPFTKLPTTDGCKIIYDHKCYTWDKGFETFTLEKAKQQCERKGFNLGNIYDDCLYSYIKNKVDTTVTLALWTGMNISFTAQGHTVLLRSGELARFSNDCWLNNYPNSGKGHSLLFEVKMKFLRPYETGITNEVGTRTANGGFCEKYMHA